MPATEEKTTEYSEREAAEELKLETEYAYRAAVIALADATELVQHAGDLHKRSKAAIRSSLRDGGDLNFVNDLAPDIAHRIRDDLEVREVVRAHNTALTSW